MKKHRCGFCSSVYVALHNGGFEMKLFKEYISNGKLDSVRNETLFYSSQRTPCECFMYFFAITI